jgi:hypothetical protein
MRDVEITVKHDGQEYIVELEVEVQWVDDSFDHEFGTEECGHWELDWDATNILSCTGPDGEDEDPVYTQGLMRAIQRKAEGIDFSDWDE